MNQSRLWIWPERQIIQVTCSMRKPKKEDKIKREVYGNYRAWVIRRIISLPLLDEKNLGW